MALFRCVNPRCGTVPRGHQFEGDARADGTPPPCPKCNRANPPGAFGPHVYALVFMHFMVLHPDGPIQGSWGGQYVACMPKRDYLVLHSSDPNSFTDDPREINCPSCMGTAAFKEMAKLFPEIAQREALEQFMEERRAKALTFEP